jgi:hypothetical protein
VLRDALSHPGPTVIVVPETPSEGNST